MGLLPCDLRLFLIGDSSLCSVCIRICILAGVCVCTRDGFRYTPIRASYSLFAARLLLLAISFFIFIVVLSEVHCTEDPY